MEFIIITNNCGKWISRYLMCRHCNKKLPELEILYLSILRLKVIIWWNNDFFWWSDKHFDVVLKLNKLKTKRSINYFSSQKFFTNVSGVFNYFWCVIKVTWRIIKSRVVSFSSIEKYVKLDAELPKATKLQINCCHKIFHDLYRFHSVYWNEIMIRSFLQIYFNVGWYMFT